MTPHDLERDINNILGKKERRMPLLRVALGEFGFVIGEYVAYKESCLQITTGIHSGIVEIPTDKIRYFEEIDGQKAADIINGLRRTLSKIKMESSESFEKFC